MIEILDTGDPEFSDFSFAILTSYAFYKEPAFPIVLNLRICNVGFSKFDIDGLISCIKYCLYYIGEAEFVALHKIIRILLSDIMNNRDII